MGDRANTILGLDIGTNSVGWALLSEANGKPPGIVAAGVRVFEAGLDDLDRDGRGKSRNMQRREARAVRRRLERRARRMTKLAKQLQRAGLLPAGPVEASGTRHEYLKALDLELGSPYHLRARALDEQLSLTEIGRAIYHLAQRRGFSSNRRSAPKDEEEEGKVRAGIGELHREMEQAGSRTLGEYFAGVEGGEVRVRSRYTSRQMYLDEFDAIWKAQSAYYPMTLTQELRDQLHDTIFYQRPLKSQAGLIGACELETGRKRAPWSLLGAQRFRYLQAVNNLQIIEGGTGEVRALTHEERQTLVDELEIEGDRTFAQVRRLLKLHRLSKFNLELGDEKRLVGNRTAARLSKVFGKERWLELTDVEKDAVVEDIRSIVQDETIKRRGISFWGLDEPQAEALSSVRLEDGYCAYSRQALARLLPRLKCGTSLQTAIREEYPERWARDGKPLDELPPVLEALNDSRNPMVTRSLTELRRVVNAIIREHGKPGIIRIELGRDLRQTAKARQQTMQKMRANQREREAAAERIRAEVKIENPSRDDILRIILAEECNWECPYTGKRISMSSLIGPYPQFDIEHIIPFARCLDDSFMNKTLCDAEENRRRKHDRTPYEAYGSSEQYTEMLGRVRKFSGPAQWVKLRRFEMKEASQDTLMADFTSRQLNDTRYASKLAKRYLGLLYGGVNADGVDADGKRRVQASAGQVTAMIRQVHGLNGILSKDDLKSREDHRHHAVDAVTVALTEPGTIQKLTRAAGKAAASGRRFEEVPEPWSGFAGEIKERIDGIVTSHRVSHRVRGALHKDTLYGRPVKDENGRVVTHIRKRIETLEAKDAEAIVDPRVRAIIADRLSASGEAPAKAFASPENHPRLPRSSGKGTLIHRVRIKRAGSPQSLGSDERERFVLPGSNHHLAVIGVRGAGEKMERWEGFVVTLLEAYSRVAAGQPVVAQEWGEDRELLFSLSSGDCIELDWEGQRALFRVRTVTAKMSGGKVVPAVEFAPINDARTKVELKRGGQWVSRNIDPLRKLNCRKVVVTPLGSVRYAAD